MRKDEEGTMATTSSFILPPSSLRKARVPGIGFLNRTCKSWAERREVQFLRGPPKRKKAEGRRSRQDPESRSVPLLLLLLTAPDERLCSSRAEQASHKREVGGSSPPIATKIRVDRSRSRRQECSIRGAPAYCYWRLPPDA